MTLLVGNSDTTGYTLGGGFGGTEGAPDAHVAYGWTASETGTATALYAYMKTGGYGTLYKFYIANSSGTILAISSPVNASSADPGWVSGAISDTAITSGQTYYLGMIADDNDSNYFRWATTGDAEISIYYAYSLGADYYTNTPTAKPTGTISENKFLMYADGTVGASDVKKVKFLAHPSAQSASGIEVVVFSAPSGTDYITGTTRYGSDNALSFDGTLDTTTGQAVLKVLASDVGADALAVDTVVAGVARNTTYTTGVIEGTIIEEAP
jgi:hypothetical protein